MAKLLEKGNFLSIISQMKKDAINGALTMAKAGMDACYNVDLILSGVGGLFAGISISEKLDILFMQAYYIPFTPTKDFPSFLIPKISFINNGFLTDSHIFSQDNSYGMDSNRQIIWHAGRYWDLRKLHFLDLIKVNILIKLRYFMALAHL